jgi:hypothetical protein
VAAYFDVFEGGVAIGGGVMVIGVVGAGSKTIRNDGIVRFFDRNLT